jgi:hypothetical protein
VNQGRLRNNCSESPIVVIVFGEGCGIIPWLWNRRRSFYYKSVKIRGPSEKFSDSPYYSESELRGGAVTVSFFEVPPLVSDALVTTLHPLLENVLKIVDHFEISFLRAPFSWLEKPRNRMGRDLN